MLKESISTERGLTRMFLNIDKEGRLVYNKDGEKKFFDSVSGTLSGIQKREREYNGEKVLVWNISLKDSETREEYILSLRYESGVFRSIVLSLASLPVIGKEEVISIHPYSKDGFTKVIVRQGDTKLDWIEGGKKLPQAEEVNVAGKIYKDTSKRDAYIEKLVAQINNLINA